MTLTERDLDTRTLRRNLERGRINEADVIRALDALPDVSSNIAQPSDDDDSTVEEVTSGQDTPAEEPQGDQP